MPTTQPTSAQRLAEDGVVLIPGVVSQLRLTAISQVVDQLLAASESGAGLRNLLRISPEIVELANSPALVALAQQFLSPAARPVKALLFDKGRRSNWLVPWHQDVMIAVRQRIDVPGYGPWSEKNGVMHVQPPVEVLQRMVALRLHLDPATAAAGALRVVPGSHRFGKLPPRKLEHVRASHGERICEAQTGDVLALKPLLLHSSAKATRPEARRVLHFEYADTPLPGGLEWAVY